jgi:hypothetical protein
MASKAVSILSREQACPGQGESIPMVKIAMQLRHMENISTVL